MAQKRGVALAIWVKYGFAFSLIATEQWIFVLE
jgi:hypothetical protein